jgi:hypothetical protein
MLTRYYLVDAVIADRTVAIAARILNGSLAFFKLYRAIDGSVVQPDAPYIGGADIAASWTLPPDVGAVEYNLEITGGNIAGTSADALVSVTQRGHVLRAFGPNQKPVPQPAKITQIAPGNVGLADLFINY